MWERCVSFPAQNVKYLVLLFMKLERGKFSYMYLKIDNDDFDTE